MYPKLGDDVASAEPFTVVCHDEERDDYVGVCPDGTGNIRLTRADLLVYEPDLHRFAQQLAASLGLTLDYAEMTEPARTWRVGVYHHAAGMEATVYLTVPAADDHVRLAAATFALRHNEPWLILTPTRCAPQALRAPPRGGVVALHDVLEADRVGSITVRPAARGLFERLLRPNDGTAAGACVFRRAGKARLVQFEGKTTSVSDTKGCRYIEFLLARPSTRFHVAEVLARATDVAGLDKVARDAGQAVLDGRAWAESRRHHDELAEEIEEARRRNDSAAVDRLQTDLERLAAQMRAAQGRAGRDRRIGSTSENSRKAVCIAITRALAAIRKEHKPLARHLKASLRLGTFIQYVPDTPATWQL